MKLIQNLYKAVSKHFWNCFVLVSFRCADGLHIRAGFGTSRSGSSHDSMVTADISVGLRGLWCCNVKWNTTCAQSEVSSSAHPISFQRRCTSVKLLFGLEPWYNFFLNIDNVFLRFQQTWLSVVSRSGIQLVDGWRRRGKKKIWGPTSYDARDPLTRKLSTFCASRSPRGLIIYVYHCWRSKWNIHPIILYTVLVPVYNNKLDAVGKTVCLPVCLREIKNCKRTDSRLSWNLGQGNAWWYWDRLFIF